MTLNFSGDLLWHSTLFPTAERDAAGQEGVVRDFYPMFESLTPFISRADLAVCQGEVPFAPAEGPFSGYPLFAAPQEVADALPKVGWDLCATASNHTMDQGWEGLVRTIDVYEAAGIETFGSYRTAEEASTPDVFTTQDGVKVAFVSQTLHLNGLSTPPGKEWAVDLIDVDHALAEARLAKKAGADIVGVHLHAGSEYDHTPSEQQTSFAEAVTRSPDVDFIYGQHAHVVQPIDKVNGKWVLYGAGNLVAQSGPSKPITYDGYVAELTLVEREDGTWDAPTVEWAPTWTTHWSTGEPVRVQLIPDVLAAGDGVASDLEASAARTREVVNRFGVDGLVERTVE